MLYTIAIERDIVFVAILYAFTSITYFFTAIGFHGLSFQASLTVNSRKNCLDSPANLLIRKGFLYRSTIVNGARRFNVKAS